MRAALSPRRPRASTSIHPALFDRRHSSRPSQPWRWQGLGTPGPTILGPLSPLWMQVQQCPWLDNQLAMIPTAWRQSCKGIKISPLGLYRPAEQLPCVFNKFLSFFSSKWCSLTTLTVQLSYEKDFKAKVPLFTETELWAIHKFFAMCDSCYCQMLIKVN